MEEYQDNKKLFGVIPIIRPDSARIFPIVVGCIAVVFIVMIIIGIKIFIEQQQSRVDLLYTPTSAVVMLDGELVESGEIVVSPGTHEITAEKYGFEPQTITVEAEAGRTVSAHIVLVPNTDDASDWYYTHENDGKIVEGVVGYQSENEREEMMNRYPVLKKLPINKKEFKIYQQICDEEKMCILVDAYKENYGVAIDYFRDELDGDVGRYHFVFRNYFNPFLGEG